MQDFKNRFPFFEKFATVAVENPWWVFVKKITRNFMAQQKKIQQQSGQKQQQKPGQMGQQQQKPQQPAQKPKK
ncbi:MAG: hypothetical protein FJZ63_05485 [Chlamydiae bacterium]|nr:hypothetical protein [Chlamydiota bacterium]